MAELGKINLDDILGGDILGVFEERLPKIFRDVAKEYISLSTTVSSNKLNFNSNAANIKKDAEAINLLRDANNKLAASNAEVTKNDLLQAKITKELSQAKLADAKATEILERAQQRKIAADLKEAESIKRKKDAQNTPITAQGSYSGASDTLPIDQAQQKLTEAQAEAQVQATEAAGATKVYSDALKENAAAQTVDAGAITENLIVSKQLSETLIVAKAELSAVNLALKENTLAYKSGTISEAEFVATGQNLLRQQSELKAIISTTNSELTKQTKANLAASGSMEKLSIDLEILKTEYKALNAEQRASPFGLALQENIKKADANIKSLSATIGENQRNVGNYTGGISKAFSGAFSFLRQIAYIIPGLGIAGIFNLAFEAISKLTTGMGELTKEQKKYKESINSIEESSRSSAQQDIARLNVLTSLAASESQTMKTRLGAIKELQDTYPNTFGNLKQQAILEGNLGDAVNKTTQALLQRAAFQAAEKKYAAASELVYDLHVKEEDAALAAGKAQNAYNKALEEGKKGKTAYAEGLDENTGLGKATVAFTNTQRVLKNVIKDRLEAEKEQKRYLEDAVKFSEKAGDALKFKQPKNTSAKELREQMREEDQLAKAQIAAQKELSDAIRDNRAALAEENVQTNKKIFEDETQTLDMRMEAYSEYYAARQNQAKFNAQKELSDINELEAQISKIRGEDPSHHSAADKALLLRAEGLAERRKGIEYKLASDLQEISTQSANDQIKILESYSQREIRLLETRIKAAKDNESQITSDEMIELTSRLKSHQLTWKKYQYEKAKIVIASNKESLDTEISAINNVLLTETLSEEAQEKLINKKYDLIKKRREEDQKSAEDAAKEDLEKFEKTVSEIANIASSLGSSYFDFQKNRIQGELDALDAEKEKINENLQLQLDAINALGLSEEERLKRTSEAEARAAAQTKNIDDEKRKRSLEQARFDKAQAIFNIIVSTAAAVAKLLVTPPLAIAAAILGAAQLAAAAAAPLPKYAKGTKGHKGGFAEVGDGYERELIQDGNNTYWSPSVPTVVYMGKGAKVTPESDLIKIAHSEAVRNIGNTVTPESYANAYINSFERLIGGVSNEMKTLNTTVKNQKSAYINITGKGMEYFTKQANSRTEYKNKNVHF
jgi:hypothetical protein